MKLPFFILSLVVALLHQSSAFALPSKHIEVSTSKNQNLRIQNNRYFYSFGNQQIHHAQWANFSLRNTGNSPLYIRGVFIKGSSFDAWTNCPEWLQPQERCLTTVEFRPWHVGYFTGLLRFSFPNENIYIDLQGWGVEW